MSKFGKIAVIVGGLMGMLLLLRVGAAIPASILGFILFLTALAERFLRIHYLRQAAGRGHPPREKAPMTAEEAREVLGLEAGASPKEIKQAHRRLMAKIHPDQGGTNYLAVKLNQAKEALLREERA
jgi:hypothetical protein